MIAPELAGLVVPLDSMKPWPKNPRRGDIEGLRTSLRAFGQLKPILVQQSTRQIVAGNQVWEAARAEGWDDIAAVLVDLDDLTARRYLLADNRWSELGSNDEDALAVMLRDLQAQGDAALEGVGYTAQDLDRYLGTFTVGDPDEIPEVAPADVWVKPGQLFRLGEQRLLCGSAIDPVDVARLLDGAEPTLLVTDPPYGVSLDPTWRDGVYNALGPAEQPYMRQGGADGQPGAEGATEAPHGAHGRTAGHRNTTISGDTRVDWSEAFALVPSLQVGYVWHAGVHAAEVAEGLERIGFEIVQQVIWDKTLFAMGRSWYHWAHEPCWVVRKPGIPHLFIGTRDQATVWRAPSPKMIMSGSTEEKMDHPTQKPVVLFETPLANHEGDVYDPFVGSGTALIAAQMHHRRCYAMEISERYTQIVLQRWQDVTGEQAVEVGA